jgi:chemotaxis protein histidine kinase CheA
MSSEDVDRALHRAFAADLESRADRVERYLLDLQDEARRDELANALALEAHNLKGTALTLGLGEVEGLADGLESLAARVARGEAAVTPELVATLTGALRSFAVSTRPRSDGAGEAA